MDLVLLLFLDICLALTFCFVYNIDAEEYEEGEV